MLSYKLRLRRSLRLSVGAIVEARSAETMRPGVNLSSQLKKFLKKKFLNFFQNFFIKFCFFKIIPPSNFDC